MSSCIIPEGTLMPDTEIRKYCALRHEPTANIGIILGNLHLKLAILLNLAPTNLVLIYF